MDKEMMKLKNEMNKVMVGREGDIELMMIALLQGGHLLLESVPGTGKTLLAKTFSKSIKADFKRIQFTPDVLPSDVTGIQFFDPKSREFQLRPGPVVTNILLADEINRATPRTQSSLLEAMEERQVTIDGTTIKVEEPFMVIATQNPVESQQGTFPLPAAQLDRFFMKIKIPFPSFQEEKEILKRFRTSDPLEEVEEVLSTDDIRKMRKQVKEVYVSDDLENYILYIIQETRTHSLIEGGVSSRAALALMRAAQGAAFIQGRDFATPGDVKALAANVLLHRMQLTPDASLTKSIEGIFQEILERVSVPVESGA
ncbi:AAA family ATPase [Falsibacillus pallidus]|uniref:MoxR-like ATPase n=1 Tax=Falsibacillus pallidus TaxID=493781 RepID=A0A370GVV2_9BACI|nr:MoxR family ATPase [Falsibacillus pallidus]RDI47661.1 MoxR-like ATPase [Falsibacillus pallidus]